MVPGRCVFDAPGINGGIDSDGVWLFGDVSCGRKPGESVHEMRRRRVARGAVALGKQAGTNVV